MVCLLPMPPVLPPSFKTVHTGLSVRHSITAITILATRAFWATGTILSASQIFCTWILTTPNKVGKGCPSHLINEGVGVRQLAKVPIHKWRMGSGTWLNNYSLPVNHQALCSPWFSSSPAFLCFYCALYTTLLLNLSRYGMIRGCFPHQAMSSLRSYGILILHEDPSIL